MEIVTTIAAARAAVGEVRARGERVGFVPTMGALHEGHLSLVARSRQASDFTVMSVFVNPLQFAPTEDLAAYPRPIEDDEHLAEGAGVNLLFRPDVSEMYHLSRTVTVTAGDLARQWEGASRPGHFDGVLTVVAKLFNIISPDISVFGRKDLQQSVLVSALIRDLNLDIELVVAPIVREFDGLALSSRNRYLSAHERATALSLSRTLRSIQQLFKSGERDLEALEAGARGVLARDACVTLDYLAIVDRETFQRPGRATSGNAAIIAARVGTTRLIDNMILGQDDQD
ncbi:MAG: pantoate--beta-alanine ligase [Gemmatimonadaceae bacterium]